jgi:hypothetical protein
LARTVLGYVGSRAIVKNVFGLWRWPTAKQQTPGPTKHSGQPHIQQKKNQQTNKTMNGTHAWEEYDKPT